MSGGWLLFVPTYQCAPQIQRTLAQLDAARLTRFAEVLVVDNGSVDGTPQRALAYAREHLAGAPVRVVRNDTNYGLGGSHKIAFQHCLDRGYDGVVVFHGDDQGRLADLLDVLPAHADADCVLGARFMPGSRLEGYSLFRILGNLMFNLLFSVLCLRPLWDLGSGLNAYSRRFLEQRVWEGCADDLTFNYHLLLRTAGLPGVRVSFVPISWREDDQTSNVRLWRQGWQMIGMAVAFLFRRRRFTTADHATAPRPRTFTPVAA